MEQKKEAKKVCAKCGKEYVNHYDGDVSFIMEAENVCFTCAFWIWQHRVDQEGKRKYAIINGKHYVLDRHTDRIWPVGSCGRVYTIRFQNGETVVCVILLGGWGNGFGNGFGGGMDGIYPWMNQSNQINGGFRDQMIFDNVTSIRDGINGIGTQLCNGFAGVAQQMSNNQMADMERSFAVQSALQNCCCENRAGIADLKYTVATENCADRTAAMQNTRDIIDSQTRGTQAILDKLCALELDGVKNQLAQAQRENLGLQNQINMANLAASQVQQTGNIRDTIIGELRSCPIPSQPVYGNQPIFTCGGNTYNGCGCGA